MTKFILAFSGQTILPDSDLPGVDPRPPRNRVSHFDGPNATWQPRRRRVWEGQGFRRGLPKPARPATWRESVQTPSGLGAGFADDFLGKAAPREVDCEEESSYFDERRRESTRRCMVRRACPLF